MKYSDSHRLNIRILNINFRIYGEFMGIYLEIYSEIYYIFQFIRIFGIFGKLKNSHTANSMHTAYRLQSLRMKFVFHLISRRTTNTTNDLRTNTQRRCLIILIQGVF